MKFKHIGYAAFIVATAAAIAIGSATPSQAKSKKKMAAPPPQPVICFNMGAPVCATKAGAKYTFANACWAAREGAKVIANKACPAPKAMKAKKAGGKKMAKPAKKKEMKKKM